MLELPESVASQKIPSPQIPEKVATYAVENVVDKTEEENFFLLSFFKYDDDLCEINFIDKVSRFKKALKMLRLTGKVKHKDNTDNFRKHNIFVTPVANSHEYSKLYTKKLHPDAEIFEYSIGESERMFYYIIENIMYIVAITHRHFETKKK